MICKAKTKTCRKCKYRYIKKDNGCTNCPKCNEVRRCGKRAVTGYEVCGSHGAGSPKKGRPGGRPRESMLSKPRSKKDILEQSNPRFGEAIRSYFSDEKAMNVNAELGIIMQMLSEAMKELDYGSFSFVVEQLKKAKKILDYPKTLPQKTDEEKAQAYKAFIEAALEANGILSSALSTANRQAAADRKIQDLVMASGVLVKTQTDIDAKRQRLFTFQEMANIILDFVEIIEGNVMPRIESLEEKRQFQHIFSSKIRDLTGIEVYPKVGNGIIDGEVVG
jgi:hypothetical protein